MKACKARADDDDAGAARRGRVADGVSFDFGPARVDSFTQCLDGVEFTNRCC